ncbi:hypothetical protein [Formosa sp. PL04]|uniref:hypothetical protein n=1 Tax=Formosa sp. PL04 TaxID=3081755 RepID=UPI002981B0A4|nr:hypothetical protein [Formosa sp. PL04]
MIDLYTDPFTFADNLWKSFQQKTNHFINNNGGTSSITPPITDNRPDWEEVKDVLQGKKPISDLECN